MWNLANSLTLIRWICRVFCLLGVSSFIASCALVIYGLVANELAGSLMSVFFGFPITMFFALSYIIARTIQRSMCIAKAVENYAKEEGFGYYKDPPEEFHRWLPNFEVFRDVEVNAKNILVKRIAEKRVLVFECTTMRRDSNSISSHRLFAIMLNIKCSFPRFLLVSDGFSLGFRETSKPDEIKLSGSKTKRIFAKLFALRSEYDSEIQTVFSDIVCEFFCRQPKFSTEFNGSLAVWRDFDSGDFFRGIRHPLLGKEDWIRSDIEELLNTCQETMHMLKTARNSPASTENH